MNKSKLMTAFLLCLFYMLPTQAQKILVGTESADITFKLPAALQGQLYLRIADSIESPLTANVIVIESYKNDVPSDTAIFVSCDLTFITSALSKEVRAGVKKLAPDFSVQKIVLTATHTHTVPVYSDGVSGYPIPPEITQPRAYFDYLSSNIATAIVQAWKKRRPALVSWGLGQAVVAYNRRAVYKNGQIHMYGNTNTPDFKNIEGIEDHDLNALFFHNLKGKLIAISFTVPCPAQEVEGHEAVNADFWHDVRVALRKRWGKDLAVIGWTGASGDMSPRPLYGRRASDRMIKLAGRTRMQEIAHRIDIGIAETYNVLKKVQFNDVIFSHVVDSITLPIRLVTEKEYRNAKIMVDTIKSILAVQPELVPKRQGEQQWYQQVVDRYYQQKVDNNLVQTEIHAVRIGDIVIATNEFELFTDYGIRMQARSKALQTFVVQLAVGYYIYLPTETAEKGGGYSAIIQSCIVGHEGGDILVDKSVELMNSLFMNK
jgi:hypothetical protein